MASLMPDFITSLDGYASAEGWPGWWGLQGPEYLAWLEGQPEGTHLMGADKYRLIAGLTGRSKVVFSSSRDGPLTWANSTLVPDDAVHTVRAMKQEGSGVLSTIGS